jgi:hypothetical protein
MKSFFTTLPGLTISAVNRLRLIASLVFIFLLNAIGLAQTTTVSKTYTSSGGLRFGAGVTTVGVSMWGGGGGGSAGGMQQYVNATDYYLHFGAGGGASNWGGGSFTAIPGAFYPFTVGTGGAAGGFDGNGQPLGGGNGTQTYFNGMASYGGYGGTISGYLAYGGARADNSIPNPGEPYAGNGNGESETTGGNGGRSNDGPYGPSSGINPNNWSGLGWPQVLGMNHGGPGVRPGDGGGGGGFTTLPFPFRFMLAERRAGGAGANGIITFYITYPTYRITQPLIATKLCGPGTPIISVNSLALYPGSYTVTYSTSNPVTTGNTASMTINNQGYGTFTTIPLTQTSTITITNLASGNTCSDAITANNTVAVVIQNLNTNDWDQQVDFAGTARSHAAAFNIGNKAYVGTGKNGSTLTNDFWQFDQATNAWTQLANFGGGARADAVGLSIGTKGYIGTGNDGSADKNDFWQYDPFMNRWTAKAPFIGQPRHGASAVTIGGKGYISLGSNGTSHYIDFNEYDPATNAWTAKAVFANNVSGAGRTNAIAFSVGTKAYMGMGLNNLGAYTKDLWEYNQATNIWTQVASMPGVARTGAAAFSIGSKGYVGIGWSGTANLNDFYVYDPATNGWLTTSGFTGAARAYAVGFSLGNKGYIGTGVASSTYYKDMYEFTPGRAVITTGALSATAFCAGSTLNVPLNTGCGGYNGENVFTAQLSDRFGSFASPVNIGSMASSTGGLYLNIPATIPSNTVAGSGYRIRVVGSSPETIGNDNGVDIGIKTAAASTVTAGVNNSIICIGDAVNLTATVSTPATSDTTVLLSENFNSGAPSWQILNANSYPDAGAINEIFTNGQSGYYSNDNSSFYVTMSMGRFSTDVTNTTLQSPMFSTLGMNSASLSFYHHFYYGNYHDQDSARIQISKDNGVSWKNVYLNNTTTVGDPQTNLRWYCGLTTPL